MLYWYLKNLPRERDQCRECRVSFALVSNLIKFAINVVSRRRCEPLLIKLVIPLYVLLSPFSYVAKAPLVLALNRENSTGLIPTFQYIRAGGNGSPSSWKNVSRFIFDVSTLLLILGGGVYMPWKFRGNKAEIKHSIKENGPIQVHCFSCTNSRRRVVLKCARTLTQLFPSLTTGSSIIWLWFIGSNA